MPTVAAAPMHDATWLGHPRGLLVLYMVQQLLLPGHVENVAGIESLRHMLESVTGPMSTQAFAGQIFGLYAGLVYLTPIMGGIISDRWLGARVTVLIGIALMTAGHFFMTFGWSALLAITRSVPNRCRGKPEVGFGRNDLPSRTSRRRPLNPSPSSDSGPCPTPQAAGHSR